MYICVYMKCNMWPIPLLLISVMRQTEIWHTHECTYGKAPPPPPPYLPTYTPTYTHLPLSLAAHFTVCYETVSTYWT